jgi:hypothetical protein
MIRIRPGRASDADGKNSRFWCVRLFSDHPITVATALILAGYLNIPSNAYAQSSQDTASCIEKCKADEKQCVRNGSSEELCEYDSKGCQKACSETKN